MSFRQKMFIYGHLYVYFHFKTNLSLLKLVKKGGLVFRCLWNLHGSDGGEEQRSIRNLLSPNLP